MTDANETAWTAEGGKVIPNAVNESSEGTGFSRAMACRRGERASGGVIAESYA